MAWSLLRGSVMERSDPRPTCGRGGRDVERSGGPGAGGLDERVGGEAVEGLAERLAPRGRGAVVFGAQRLLDHVGEGVVVPAGGAGLPDAADEFGRERVVEFLELDRR